jgi:uncharacterized damage-inducible protein DinB
MRLRSVMAALVLGACSMMAIGQMNMPAKSGSSSTSPAKALDDMLSMFEHEVMGVAKTMPADKYDFAPSQEIFKPSQKVKFATVRTFGQQATHLIQANYLFYSSFSGMKPDVDVKKIETLTKKDDIVAALAASFVFAHKAIATITPANAFEPIKSVDGLNTRATVAAFGVAHGNDHYGQMVEYLRMNGLAPPGSN